MIDWETFVSRRNIDVNLFLLKNKITSKIQFIEHLQNRHIIPPDEEKIDALFLPEELDQTLNNPKEERNLNEEISIENSVTSSRGDSVQRDRDAGGSIRRVRSKNRGVKNH